MPCAPGSPPPRGTIVAIQDADLELDPSELAALTMPILRGDSGVVYGSRFLAGRPQAPWLTIAANRLLTGLTNVLYGSNLTDMETCYKVMRSDIARSLALESNGFDIEPEITAKILRGGHSILELPVRYEARARAAGKKIGWRDGWRAMQVLIQRRVRPQPPGQLAMTAPGIAGSRTGRWRQAAPMAVAALATVAAAFIGMARGTHAAGGSDSHCYLGQADAFAAGRTFLAEPLASIAAWPSARATLSPAGFLPSETRSGASVPICPPGLSLMMAPLVRIDIAGESAAFLVVPLLGALGVWLTYQLGRTLASATIGALAALLLASSPIFLYQLVQPMGDVPAMTWWIAAAVLLMRRKWSDAFFAGLAAAAAIVTRPNLVPLAAVLGIYAMCTSFRSLMAFAAGAAPGAIVIVLLNAMRYGSWASTGYGSTAALFSIGNIVPNLIPVSGLVAHHAHAVSCPCGRRAMAGRRWPARARMPAVRSAFRSDVVLALAMVAAVFACYLAYVVFDVWWYSRFLLPALPFLIVLSVMVLAELLRRASGRTGLA